MDKLQRCHPCEVRAGDRLNHAGAVVAVNWVEERWNTFRLDICCEMTGSVNWIFIAKSAPKGPPVLRYEK